MTSCRRPILGSPREWAIRLTVATAVGGFFGVIGPFGSFAQPFASRVAYWIVGFWIGVTVFSISIRAARVWSRGLDAPEWFVVGATVAIICQPYSLALGWMFDGFVWRPLRPEAALHMYGQALLFAAPITAIAVYLDRHRQALTHAVAPAPAAAPALLPESIGFADPVPSMTAFVLDRLPVRLGRELLALQMEDHYVRVHTRRGSDLLLMPLAQAIQELGNVDGLRVHRSWWVARTAVEGARLDGRNLRLRLHGGLEAPVARAQIAGLRAAGWPTEAAAPALLDGESSRSPTA